MPLVRLLLNSQRISAKMHIFSNRLRTVGKSRIIQVSNILVYADSAAELSTVQIAEIQKPIVNLRENADILLYCLGIKENSRKSGFKHIGIHRYCDIAVAFEQQCCRIECSKIHGTLYNCLMHTKEMNRSHNCDNGGTTSTL